MCRNTNRTNREARPETASSNGHCTGNCSTCGRRRAERDRGPATTSRRLLLKVLADTPNPESFVLPLPRLS